MSVRDRELSTIEMSLNKLKRIPLFAVFFTYLFVMSGIVVSLLCMLLLVIVWPFSKNAYRRITSQLAYTILGRELIHSYYT